MTEAGRSWSSENSFSMPAAGGRNEAYVPTEDSVREARFLRGVGNGNANPISLLMSSLYDEPTTTDTFYKSHLQAMEEGSARRELMCSLPGHDHEEANRLSRNYRYLADRGGNASSPKVGTAAYFLAEMQEKK